MAKDIRTAANEAISALEASRFAGNVSKDTYVSKTAVGVWKPISLASLDGRPKFTGGTFDQTGARAELTAYREAADGLADDPSVKSVGFETNSRLEGINGPLLTIRREVEGKLVTDKFPLNQVQELNGSERLVGRVLAGIPAVVKR